MVIIIVVAFVGGWFGIEQVNDGIVPDGRNLFQFMAPSIVQGAGLGIGCVSCSEEEFPAMQSFMRGESNVIPSSQYPENCEQPFTATGFYYSHIYLFLYLGLLFRIFGISIWTFQLAGVFMHVIAMLALYALCRVAMGRILSLACVLLIATSPAYLVMLTSLRDFGKAPFVLFVLFLLGLVITGKENNKWQLLLLSALLGLVIGIGYGFRIDLLIFLPCAVTIIFLTGGKWNRKWNRKAVIWRLVCICIMLLVYGCMAIAAIRGNHNVGQTYTAHTLHQGIKQKVENSIGVVSPSYDFGYTTYDPLIIASINNYARLSDMNYPVIYPSQEYGKAGIGMIKEILLTYPADFITRALAASLQVNYILSDNALDDLLNDSMFDVTQSPALLSYLKTYNKWMRYFPIVAVLSFLICLVLIAAESYFYATILLFLYLFLGAYPALLFEFRHYFHLAFIPVFFTGFALSLITKRFFSFLSTIKGRNKPVPEHLSKVLIKVLRGSAFLILATTILISGIQIARFVQKPQVKSIYNALNNLKLTPITCSEEQKEDTVILRPSNSVAEAFGTIPSKEYDLVPAYLAIGFSGAQRTIDFYIHNKNLAFRRPCTLSLHDNDLYIFPVLEFGWERNAIFEGVEFNKHDMPYVTGMYVVESPPPLNYWPYMHIPSDPENFQAWKTSSLDALLQVITIEIQAVACCNPNDTALKYATLLKRWPNNSLYLSRALAYIQKSQSFSTKEKAWEIIGAYVPAMRKQASNWFSEQARKTIEKGDYELAISLYESASSVMPQNPAPVIHQADLLEEMGAIERAVEVYQHLLEDNPESPIIAKKLNTIYEELQTSEDSISFWKQTCNAHPTAVIPRVYLGITLERAGEIQDAIQAYEQSLNAGKNAEALYRLAALQISGGSYKTGIAMIQDALGLEPEIAGRIELTCAELARQAEEKGDINEAITLYELAHSIAPDEPWYRIHIGKLSEKTGHIPHAIKIYQEVLEEYPDLSIAANTLDTLFRQEEMNDEALAFWRKSSKNHPEAITPLLYLGISLEYTNDRQGAIQTYEQALKSGASANVLYRLAALRILNGALEDGIKEMHAAARQEPELIGRIGQRCAELAVHFIEAKDQNTAISLYETAVEIDPENPWYRIHLGELLEKKGDSKSALEIYCSVLETIPESPVAATKLDALFQHAEFNKRALPFWNKLCQRYTDAVTPRLYLAVTLERHGDVQGAVHAYEQVLETADNAEALYRLGALRIAEGVFETGMDMIRAAANQNPELAGHIGQRCAELAVQFENKDNIDAAISLYELASAVAPHDLWHHVRLGEALEKKGHTERAINIFSHILKTAPESPVTAEKLDAIFKRTKRDKQALDFWSQLCISHPESNVARKYVDITRQRIEDSP